VLRQFAALDRSMQLLMINELTLSLSFYMLYPYLAIYFTQDLGMATGAVGLVLGIRVLFQQGLTILGGTLADLFGYKPVIVAGLALRTIGFGLFAVVTSFWGVLAASILSGLAGALFSPAVRGYIATGTVEGRAEVFAINNVFGRAGMLAGPPLGVVLLLVSFQLMALVAAALFLLLAVLQFALLAPRTGTPIAGGSVLGAWREVFANRPFILFSLAMLGSLALFNQLYLGLPLEVARVTGGPAAAGMLFTLSGVLTIVGQMPVTRFCQARWRAPRSLVWGLALMGIAFVPPMLTQGVLPVEGVPEPLAMAINVLPVATSGALLTLGLMITNPFSQELIPVLGRERLVATYFGVFSMAGGLATAVSTFAVGAAFDASARVGLPALPWLFMTLIGLGSAAGMALLDRGERLPAASPVRAGEV
jgi:Na+/melibiose symporter-like transporter